jgi:hypothetical protein
LHVVIAHAHEVVGEGGGGPGEAAKNPCYEEKAVDTVHAASSEKMNCSAMSSLVLGSVMPGLYL